MPRSVLPAGLLSKEGQKAYDATRQESDLACALILASYVDQCLAALLHAYLRRSSVTDAMLNPPTGIASSFEARARLSYALALISKPQYQNLDRIAQIRNHFAHSRFDVKFEEPTIMKLCDELVLPEIQFQGAKDQAAAREAFQSTTVKTPRTKYVFNSILLSSRLLLTALGVTRVSENRNPRSSGA